MSSFRPAVGQARWILLRAQKTSLHGRGGYSDSLAARGCSSRFPQAEVERDDVGAFFGLFADSAIADSLRDRVVLDFGSGYGGKTVEYRRQYCARRVCGIEPFANMVEKSRQYAAASGVPDVEFAVCAHRDIPYDDESFDVVVSHDVLEHIADPLSSMREIRRVLRPGGLSLNVFPVYFGAMSHHLDYIARVPPLVLFAIGARACGEQHSRAGRSLWHRETAAARAIVRRSARRAAWLERVVRRAPGGAPLWFRGPQPAAHRPWTPRNGPDRPIVAPVRVRDGVTATIACVLRKPAHRADG